MPTDGEAKKGGEKNKIFFLKILFDLLPLQYRVTDSRFIYINLFIDDNSILLDLMLTFYTSVKLKFYLF